MRHATAEYCENAEARIRALEEECDEMRLLLDMKETQRLRDNEYLIAVGRRLALALQKIHPEHIALLEVPDYMKRDEAAPQKEA